MMKLRVSLSDFLHSAPFSRYNILRDLHFFIRPRLHGSFFNFNVYSDDLQSSQKCANILYYNAMPHASANILSSNIVSRKLKKKILHQYRFFSIILYVNIRRRQTSYWLRIHRCTFLQYFSIPFNQ